VNDPQVLGREAEQSDWLDVAARIGLVAYGIVYLLVGWLAVQLALGDHSENASPNGALAELAKQPFGEALVWAVAVGLVLLVVWRLVEAFFGHRDQEGADRVRKRLASGGKAVIYGALAVTAFKVAVAGGSGSSGGSSQTQKTMTAKLMDLPAGQWIVAAVGVAIIGYAVGVAWRGWKEKFADNLETEGKLGWSGAAYLLLGKVGHIAKGIAFAIVGSLFVYAGVTHESGETGGLDQALQKVLQQPFGPYLLLVIAAGIICYGLFCFAWARHLDR
jgi:type IV secretory pathway VirB2 component (pilin)